MTPCNIAGMAHLVGLGIVALTDHNSVDNCPAFFAACKEYGIVPIAGMELTTAEDIHLLCIFETLDEALAFGAAVKEHRMKIKNRVEVFGEQPILNERDEKIGEDPYFLPAATDLDLSSAADLVASFHGVCWRRTSTATQTGFWRCSAHFRRNLRFRLRSFAIAKTPDSPKENDRRLLGRASPLGNRRCGRHDDARHRRDRSGRSAARAVFKASGGKAVKELSLNILDIAQNSIRAEATLIEILLDETETSLKLTIKDNGYGMSEDFLKTVVDPFSTTRTTRKVGMGIPLLKLAAEQTGERYDPVHGACGRSRTLRNGDLRDVRQDAPGFYAARRRGLHDHAADSRKRKNGFSFPAHDAGPNGRTRHARGPTGFRGRRSAGRVRSPRLDPGYADGAIRFGGLKIF